MKIRVIILLCLIVLSLTFGSFVFEVSAQENVSIISSTIYQTYGYTPFSVSKGDYIVAGEVENSGSVAQAFNLTATFYDVAGSILGSTYLSNSLADAPACYLHVLLPNQKSPFLVWFSRFDEQGNFRVVDHYDLTVTASPAESYTNSILISSVNSREVASTFYVEGNIENIGSAIMDTLNVYVTYYKENGDILAVSAESGRGLAPNEVSAFSVSLNGFNEGGRLEEIDRYEVTAEGYDNSLWTADGQLISPEVAYVLGTPEATIEPTQSEVQPEVEPEVFPYLIYIIVVVGVIAIIALALFISKTHPRLR